MKRWKIMVFMRCFVVNSFCASSIMLLFGHQQLRWFEKTLRVKYFFQEFHFQKWRVRMLSPDLLQPQYICTLPPSFHILMKMMQQFLSVGTRKNIAKYTWIVWWKIWILFFFTFFLLSCSEEYYNHFYSKSSYVSEKYGFASLWSVDRFYILPDRWVKREIIQAIENAKDNIYLQIYIITDKDILQSLIDAKKRWVDVRVVLEANPYMTPYVNNTAVNILKKWNISYVFSDNDRFNFNHAKFLLIDGIYFISTGNFTKTYFEQNRDFLLRGKNSEIYSALKNIFLADFSHTSVYFQEKIPIGLVISPINTRESIEYLLQNARTEIRIFVQSLTDEHLLQLLAQKKKEGIPISICLWTVSGNDSLYEKYDLQYAIAKPHYLHGKIIFVDQKYIFFWSQNMTENSFERNREIWMILEPVVDDFASLFLIFQQDCQFRKEK